MYNQELNIKFWEDGVLKPEVKDKLLQIGNKWADFAKIPSNAVKDMILVGGNANYNYTRFSDLDLHLVVDKSQIADCPDLLDDYLRDKKKLWALVHDIKSMLILLSYMLKMREIHYLLTKVCIPSFKTNGYCHLTKLRLILQTPCLFARFVI